MVLSAKPSTAPAEVLASAAKSSRQSRTMVPKTALGGGTRNALIQPARTSHSSARVSTTKGIAARIALRMLNLLLPSRLTTGASRLPMERLGAVGRRAPAAEPDADPA